MKHFYLAFIALFLSAASSAQNPTETGLSMPGERVPSQIRSMTKAQLSRIGTKWDSDFVGRPWVCKTPLSTDIIKEQPEGKVQKNLYRSAKGFLVYYGRSIELNSDGYCTDIVEGDDGSFYMNEPFSTTYTGSWLKGYKGVNDTICFELPQPVVQVESYGETTTYYAFKMVLDSTKVYDKEKDTTIVQYT